MRRILLVVALVFFLACCFDLKYAKAQDFVTIVITEYGVNPPEAPIKKIGKLYIFTGDIYGRIDIFQATNIILDGAGYTLKGNGAWSGILIVDINGVTIRNLKVKGFDVGINLRLSSNITILNNVLCDNKYGIKLESSSSVAISRNTIVNNSQGILIIQRGENYPLSSENIISENVIKNNDDSILLQNSNSNLIFRNIIENNRLHGIRLENSSDNAVAENNLNANDLGIVVYGVWPNYELKNRIMKNKITNNKHGIRLFQSCNNILKDNQMINNAVDFEVSAHELLYMINDVDTSNTINGKPIRYVVNCQNIEVSGDAGYVAIINCSGVVVHHLNLVGKQGVWLAYTKNSMVTRNLLENKKYGVYLFKSFNNIISENIIRNNSYGVYFNDAYNNTLLRNTILNNNIGLYFGGSIPFRLCSNNTIHHNNFINNTKHVDDIHRSEPFSCACN